MHEEITVLGAMILDPMARQDAMAVLTAPDFSLDSHRRIFQAITTLEVVDCGTIIGELRRKKELEAVGGAGYVAGLTEGVPRNFNVQHYAKLLQDDALGRRGVMALHNAQQRLMEKSCPAAEVLDDLSRLLTQERPDDTLSAASVMPAALARLTEGNFTIIPTGLDDIDEMTYGGLRTKELWIIGAQPSAGKSALCRQIERSAIRHNYGVHAHSIEVDREKWMLQHAANVAGIPAWKLREPARMGVFDKDKLTGAALKVCDWNYRIDDAGTVGIEALLAKSRVSAMRHGTKVFTVDYLQMMIEDDRNTHREMSKIARKLKQFAKDYDVCVIALSQMKRGGDINKRPTVQDLKESGDLEAAADVVLLNYRPKDLDTDTYSGQDEIIIGKQRDGSVGALPKFFNSDKLEFEARDAKY